MIKKTITYIKNLETGDKATEDFYFNLTKGEALEINLMEELQTVGDSNDPKAIIPVFKNIINYAYGVRLPDGGFDKDPARTRGFLASDAYSELFLGLLQEGEQGVMDFITAALSFPVGDVEKLNITNPSAPKPEATRPAPQDFKKSAREIAAEAAQTKEATVASAEDHRLPEDDAEFQEWKRQRDAKKAELQARLDAQATQAEQTQVTPENATPQEVQDFFHGGVNSGLVEGQDLTEVARNPITINENTISRNSFEEQSAQHQALRRDSREA